MYVTCRDCSAAILQAFCNYHATACLGSRDSTTWTSKVRYSPDDYVDVILLIEDLTFHKHKPQIGNEPVPNRVGSSVPTAIIETNQKFHKVPIGFYPTKDAPASPITIQRYKLKLRAFPAIAAIKKLAVDEWSARSYPVARREHTGNQYKL